MMELHADNKKPFKIKDVTRNIKKAVVAGSLEEMRVKVADKFEKSDELPTIHLDCDGTEVDDEEYFRTLEDNAELIAVFSGEQWIDATHYLTIGSQRKLADLNYECSKAERVQQYVGQMQRNFSNASSTSEPDLESLSNMDPNSLVDITGKEFMEQLKDAGRPLCPKRDSENRVDLLRMLKDGAIFCSERYPEEAEAIDQEISRHLNRGQSKPTTTTTSTIVNKENGTQTTTRTIDQVHRATAKAAADAVTKRHNYMLLNGNAVNGAVAASADD